jgi:hypothetical protein
MSVMIPSDRGEQIVTALGASAACGGLTLTLWATWDKQNGFIYVFLPLLLGTAAPLVSMLAVAYVTGKHARGALQLRLRGRFMLELGAFVVGVVVPLLLAATYRTMAVAVAGIVLPGFFIEADTFPRFVGIYTLPLAALALGLISGRSALPTRPQLEREC